jgi:hypothetical protein
MAEWIAGMLTWGCSPSDSICHDGIVLGNNFVRKENKEKK